jgi:hypothetical protein
MRKIERYQREMGFNVLISLYLSFHQLFIGIFQLLQSELIKVAGNCTPDFTRKE